MEDHQQQSIPTEVHTLPAEHGAKITCSDSL